MSDPRQSTEIDRENKSGPLHTSRDISIIFRDIDDFAITQFFGNPLRKLQAVSGTGKIKNHIAHLASFQKCA